MSETDQEFRALLAKALGQSDAAAEELLQRYQSSMLRVIRKKLSKRMRSKFDSLDFAQDVWASFFADPPPDLTFDRPEDLATYLAKLAHHKVIEAIRLRLMTQKFNVNREFSLDDSRVVNKEHLTGQQPSPPDVAAINEEWQGFLRSQPLVYQRIYMLLREGKAQKEIAQELAISLKTVLRVANRFKPRSLT